MKVLTIGNATIDHFLRYEGCDFMNINKKYSVQNFMIFQADDKIEIDEIIRHTGGGATNTATSFQRLGLKATTFCAVGNDEGGSYILSTLGKEGVDTTHVTRDAQNPTATSYVINSRQGERIIFVHRGANRHMLEQSLPLEIIKDANLVYITSLSHNSTKLLPIITKEAHIRGVRVVINPGSSLLESDILTLKKSLPYIDTLIINSTEAKGFMASLFKADVSYKKLVENLYANETCPADSSVKPRLLDISLIHHGCYFTIQSFFKEVFKMGPKRIVVTDGCHGVYAAQGSTMYFHPAPHTPVVDTLGAGDAFGSAFAAALEHGESVENALRWGVVNSGSVISKIGAKDGLLTSEQLKAELKNLPEGQISTYDI
jgi:sugar/nucleoside kinase (ribokinase family)